MSHHAQHKPDTEPSTLVIFVIGRVRQEDNMLEASWGCGPSCWRHIGKAGHAAQPVFT